MDVQFWYVDSLSSFFEATRKGGFFYFLRKQIKFVSQKTIHHLIHRTQSTFIYI